MIQQNINRLIKGIILYLLFFTQILYTDISFDKDDNMYYETPKQNYRIDELHIQNNTYYVQVKGKWLIFYDTTLIGEFGYTSLVVTKHGLLGKNKTYTLLSNDLKLLQDNLMWASINNYGIVTKEKNKELLAISPDGSKKTLKGYDYAKMCSNGFYIARNIKIKKDDIDDMLTEFVVIVNQKGENMRQAMECITQMKDDENKGYVCAEKLFLQENWTQYPDFLVTLIFFLSIFDEEFQKYILRIIEYYNTIDNVFFHETIGSLLDCKGYLQSISRE